MQKSFCGGWWKRFFAYKDVYGKAGGKGSAKKDLGSGRSSENHD